MDLAYQVSLITPLWLKKIFKPVVNFFVLEKHQSKLQANAFKLLSHFINKDELVFDVGAHLGVLTDVFLKLGARVICVEPHPRCVSRLRKKYHGNNRVIIVDKGLSNREGELTFYLNELTPVFSTFSEDWIRQDSLKGQSWDKKMLVSVTTLDDLIKEYGQPQFCKIDVEGFEGKVLEGLNSRIPVISFEFHVGLLNDAYSCLEELNSLGYRSFNYSLFESYQFQSAEWVDYEKLKQNLKKFTKDTWGDIYARINHEDQKMAQPSYIDNPR